MLKEILYTGIGAVAVMKEKVEDEIKNLEKEGKIKTEDAKSFLNSLEERGAKEDEKIKDMIKSSIKEVLKDLDIATKDDLNRLKEELK